VPYFNRIAIALVSPEEGEEVLLQNLRMEFEIFKTVTRSANTLLLKIYNLSKDTISKLNAANSSIALKVGYTESSGAGVIFIGDITFVDTKHMLPDIITEIHASDGQKVLRESKLSLSYGADTAVKNILNDITAQLSDIALRPLGEIGSLAFKKGFSYTGTVEKALDKICAALKLEWSIQNNELQIIPRGKISQEEVLVISADSGLIGSPNKQENQDIANTGSDNLPGWEFTSLLESRIEPGGQVQLESREANGTFRIESVKHVGDTHASPWFSICNCIEEA